MSHPVPFLPPGDYRFPDPGYALAHCDGLVGISTDLDTERLLNAYRHGIFPWFEEDGCFYWFATAPRAVLIPQALHIGRSLAKILRHKTYRVTVNTAFADVIAACAQAARPGQPGSWISPAYEHAYHRLHQLGHAHSFECRYPTPDGGWSLAGGLYGVQIGRVFYGESMFARAADASKIAFARAVPYLAECGIELIDCQQDTHHLARFGSTLMAFNDFQAALERLNSAALVQPIGCHTL